MGPLGFMQILLKKLRFVLFRFGAHRFASICCAPLWVAEPPVEWCTGPGAPDPVPPFPPRVSPVGARERDYSSTRGTEERGV